MEPDQGEKGPEMVVVAEQGEGAMKGWIQCSPEHLSQEAE